LCAALVVHPAQAQTDAQIEAVKAEVLRAEQDFHEAKLHSDVEALGRLMADEFISINQWGVVRDKVSELQLYHHLKITSQKTSDECVRVSGDTATVIGVMSASSVTGFGRFLFLETFVKRDGHWLVLSVTHNFSVDPDTMHTRDPGSGPNAVRPK